MNDRDRNLYLFFLVLCAVGVFVLFMLKYTDAWTFLR